MHGQTRLLTTNIKCLVSKMIWEAIQILVSNLNCFSINYELIVQNKSYVKVQLNIEQESYKSQAQNQRVLHESVDPTTKSLCPHSNLHCPNHYFHSHSPFMRNHSLPLSHQNPLPSPIFIYDSFRMPIITAPSGVGLDQNLLGQMTRQVLIYQAQYGTCLVIQVADYMFSN